MKKIYLIILVLGFNLFAQNKDSLFLFLSLPVEHPLYNKIDSLENQSKNVCLEINKMEKLIIKDKQYRNDASLKIKEQYIQWEIENKLIDSLAAQKYFNIVLKKEELRFEILTIFLDVLIDDDKTMCYRLWLAEREKIRIIRSIIDQWEIENNNSDTINHTGKLQLEIE
jgi:hypothetical protein